MAPRFRFAPSPTGDPHIGNLHTALFSWALARAMQGDFILRIEDTDQARNTPEATRLMLQALQWLDIDWDEGPDIGGPSAPYIQSQRQPRHDEIAAQLVASNAAYYGDNPAQTAPPTGNPLRLRMPQQGQTIVHDALRRVIPFDNARYEDPVLVRSDGRPLYHLAAMVDDHDMGITHVVRGEEWLSSTPIHIQLYKALGWEQPVWIHLPLILNKQGQKLSKRDPEGGYLVTDFQLAGYLPGAVFNYLLLLGWSPDGEQEVADKWTVRQQFRLDRLSTSPSVFDWGKLNWLNRHYLGKLSDKKLAAEIRPFLEDAYGEMPLSEAWLVRLTAVIRDSLNKLEDAIDEAEWAFVDEFNLTPAGQQALDSALAPAILTRLIAEIATIVLLDEQTAHYILANLRQQFAISHNARPGAVFRPIRAALTGDIHGPPVHELLGIIGKTRALQRLGNALR